MSKNTEPTRFGPGCFAKVVFYVCGFMSFAVFMQAAQKGDFLHNWPTYVIFAGLLAAVSIVAGIISAGQQKRQQRERDARASQIIEDLQREDKRSYSLYLRGFFTTGRMPIFTDMADRALSAAGSEGILDIEAIVGDAVESESPLVALGKPGEQIGAGRIQSQVEQWQKDVDLLAKGATHIFVLPTDTPGTKWEIEYIMENQLIERCIFLMPPAGSNIDWREDWERTASEMQKLGIHLPPYKSNGMIFTIGKDGTVKLSISLGANAKQVKNDINELIRRVGETPEKPIGDAPDKPTSKVILRGIKIGISLIFIFALIYWSVTPKLIRFHGLSFEIPNSWKNGKHSAESLGGLNLLDTQGVTDWTLYYEVKKKTAGANILVTAYTLPKMSLEDLYSYEIQRFYEAQMAGNVSIIYSQKIINTDSIRAIESDFLTLYDFRVLSYAFIVPGSPEMQFGFDIGCKHSSFKDYEKIFRKIINSVKISNSNLK